MNKKFLSTLIAIAVTGATSTGLVAGSTSTKVNAASIKNASQTITKRVLVSLHNKALYHADLQTASILFEPIRKITNLKFNVVTKAGKDAVALEFQDARTMADIEQAITILKSVPSVRVAEPDFVLKKTTTRSSMTDPAWKDQFDHFAVNPEYRTQLEAVTDEYRVLSEKTNIAVLDTGISTLHDHQGTYIYQKNFIEEERGNDATEECFYIENGQLVPDLDDRHGHRSASVALSRENNVGVAGIASRGKGSAHRVIGCGSGSSVDVLQSLDFLAKDATPEQFPQVVTMSLGGAPNCPVLIQEAIDAISARGAIVVAAAGNSGNGNTPTPVENPASCKGVISVGALDSSGRFTSFSNFDNTLDVSSRSLNLVTSPRDSNSQVFENYDGTSSSTPSVSAVLALAKVINPNLNHNQAITLFRASSPLVPTTGIFGCQPDCGVQLKAMDFLNAVANRTEKFKEIDYKKHSREFSSTDFSSAKILSAKFISYSGPFAGVNETSTGFNISSDQTSVIVTASIDGTFRYEVQLDDGLNPTPPQDEPTAQPNAYKSSITTKVYDFAVAQNGAISATEFVPPPPAGPGSPESPGTTQPGQADGGGNTATASSATGGGGGGSLNLFGLISLAALMALLRRKSK